MKIDFERTIRKSENFLNRKGYNYQANVQYVNYIIKAIKDFYKANPTLSLDEAKEAFHKQLTEYEDNYEISSNCTALLTYEVVLENLVEDSSLLKSEYEKIKDEEITQEGLFNYEDNTVSDIIFDLDYSTIQTMLVKELTRLLREYISDDNKEVLKDIIKLNISEAKEKYNLTTSQIKSINAAKNLYIGNEFDRLKNYTSSVRDEVKQSLREIYIENMMLIGSFLEEFNLYDHYVAINKIESRKFDIEELQYTKNSDEDENESLLRYIKNVCLNKGKKSRTEIDEFIQSLEKETQKGKDNSFGLKDIFTEDFLSKRSIEEIQILNVFWQNRFAKEIKAMNDALFYVDTLNLWQDIYDGKEIDASDSKTMDAVMLKTKYIDQLTHILLSSEEGKKETVVYDSDNKIVYNVSDVLNDLESQVGEKYKNYFSKLLPGSSNDLAQELLMSMELFKNKENAYFRKDQTIITLINTFINNKKIKNWGYMEEYEDNTPISEKKYVLLGIDLEGMNMPLRVHIKRDELSDRLMELTENTIIPVYDGAKDFWRNNEYMKTHIIMPLDSVHKKIIKFLSNDKNPNDRNHNLIKHLDFLRKADNYPDHLKVKDRKGKLVRDKKFIDISTGFMYRLGKDGYESIEEGVSNANGSRGSER